MAIERSIPLICITILVTAASLTFVLFFAAALIIDHSPYAGLAIAAAFTQVLDLIFLTYRLFQQTARNATSRPATRTQTRLLWAVVATTAISHIMIFALLATLQAEKPRPSTIFRSTWNRFLYTSWALVAASLLCHAACMLLQGPRVAKHIREVSENSSNHSSTTTTKDHGVMVLQTITPSERTYERTESQTPPSDRQPMSTESRGFPAASSSLTRLVEPQSARESIIDQSQRYSIDSGMSTMPSSRSPSLRFESFYGRPSTPPQQHRLEPIPGSASNSPGRALEMAEAAPERRPDRGRRSSRSSLDSLADESRIPPRFRKNSTTRPSSPVIISESYIHPLFRTDSPLPPPTPTFTTTVTASAFGGRTLSKEDLARAQSRSRPSSPAHHPGLTSRSRQNSFGALPRVSFDSGSPTPLRGRSMEDSGSRPSTAKDEVPPLPNGGLLPSTFDI